MRKPNKPKPSPNNGSKPAQSVTARDAVSNSSQQTANCDWWRTVTPPIVCGVIGILAATISGSIERHFGLSSKCDELTYEKSNLEQRLQDSQHEKNIAEIDSKNRIDSLKEMCEAKDRKIDDLQRENSEQRLRLDGKDILIEQLRNGIDTRELTSQQAVRSIIQNGIAKTGSGALKEQPVIEVRRKFDVDLTSADRVNSLAATQAYAAQDFSNAVKHAYIVYERVGNVLESSFGKHLFVHRDFQKTIAPIFRIVAEESFARGDFANAVTQSWLAVCLEKPHPNPFTLALNSASLIRSSSYNVGFLTTDIHEAIENMPEKERDNYRNQILSTLCNMGYLQITYTSRDRKKVDAVIDWSRMFGITNPICYKKDGTNDWWSLRWEGFGKYSEYNYTKALEKVWNYRRLRHE